ncbi:type IV pilus secretin PilQ [Methylococcus mesophilus]|uniref:type IV pilus secretin PilQ n=1 Tax=Methylococcus mesophilus TaxID=2993564 RepID=UPI00224ACC2B|nr:type IV pilus secretin PilQ [Methylococcus mesophilus]UZR27914.1 type IV pilus secretin PilQ [Methylococcus mesophilus]
MRRFVIRELAGERIPLCWITGLFALCWGWAALAAGPALQAVDFTALPGENFQLRLSFDGPVPEPQSFTTEHPARIALDLAGVRSSLDKKPIPVHQAGVETVQAIAAGGRTRVIMNLASAVPYTTRVAGRYLYVTLQSGKVGSVAGNSVSAPIVVTERPVVSGSQVESVDFRRGEKGEGRLLVTLSDPNSLVSLREEGRSVVADLPGTSLPGRLARRLEVLDFATPVKWIEAMPVGRGTRLLITPVSDEYDYSSYQSGKLLTVELRPLSRAEKEEAKKRRRVFTGDRLSLNFQDIPVRNVLQILADFTNLNIVASDSVEGNVTLRLNEVPWDEALDLVLKAKGLGKRQEANSNIIRVAPMAEISRLERDELEAMKVVEDLEPLRTEIIQINYTKADDIKKVIMGTTEKAEKAITRPEALTGGPGVTSTEAYDVTQSILSSRGNVTTDPRTNQLIVQDTPRNLERIRDLVRQLDKPVRQVMIESRVVIANVDFLRELGAKLDFRPKDWTNSALPPTGSMTDLGVDLARLTTLSPYGTAQYVVSMGDYLLDLELSAAQKEGRGEIVANPRVLTADQSKAKIMQGVELPYQITQQGTGGGTPVQNVAFKPAVLELDVTPHITPDDHILMDLMIKKDDKGELTPSGNFAIDKREIDTVAQVANGETVVLGGVYEGTRRNNTDKVPFFGDLPGIGFMFRRNAVEDKKKELLIFITPKIVKQTTMNP